MSFAGANNVKALAAGGPAHPEPVPTAAGIGPLRTAECLAVDVTVNVASSGRGA